MHRWYVVNTHSGFEKKVADTIKETAKNKDIRVYECINFPLEWKLKKILMKEKFR